MVVDVRDTTNDHLDTYISGQGVIKMMLDLVKVAPSLVQDNHFRKINDEFILETCFETFNLKEVASVKRNGLKLAKLLRK